MTTVYLVRHGEAEGNSLRYFQGHTDGAITEKGKQQLACLKQRFSSIPLDVIYSSDLQRAYDTAKAMQAGRDIPLYTTQQLREINGGDWEGKKWTQLVEEYGETSYYTWEHDPEHHQMPGGESMAQAQQRMKQEMTRIMAENPGKTIGVASHGTVIKAYLCDLMGYPLGDLYKVPWCDNTAVTILECDDQGKVTIKVQGDASHLTEGLSTLATQDWWKQKTPVRK